MINVSTASKDKKYVVKQIEYIQNKNMLYRLGAFGLNVGSKISIKQKCLLNGPSVVEINGQCVSIRQRDARLIMLEE
jgi:ferrous iron transport protein A